MKEQVQPIKWPSVVIAGRSLTFRVSYSSHYQLARWSKNVATATVLELAAASAGTFDEAGKWHSEGFERPVDLADMMTQEDEPLVSEAVLSALKKALPEAEFSVPPIPAEVLAPNTTA